LRHVILGRRSRPEDPGTKGRPYPAPRSSALRLRLRPWMTRRASSAGGLPGRHPGHA
jgi:hypothetical protein